MILAIDIGGTKIAAALLDGDTIVERRSTASTMHGDYHSIPRLVAELCADWSGSFNAVGIASAGLVEGRKVRFVSREGRPVIAMADEIEALFGISPIIINDAWAGALGEYSRGNIGAAETVVYVTVSTGIGAGIVHKGQLLTSSNGLMAHLGHMRSEQSGSEPVSCNCGRTNCIEAFASGTAIERLAAAVRGTEISAREVFKQEHNDPALKQLLDNAASALTEMLVNARALIGADCFILGGSVGLVPAFFARVRAQLDAQPDLWRADLRPAGLGKDAELHGAAVAALSLRP